MQHTQIVSFLWGVADLIRDTFKRGKYQDEIEAEIREIEKEIIDGLAALTGRQTHPL